MDDFELEYKYFRSDSRQSQIQRVKICILNCKLCQKLPDCLLWKGLIKIFPIFPNYEFLGEGINRWYFMFMIPIGVLGNLLSFVVSSLWLRHKFTIQCCFGKMKRRLSRKCLFEGSNGSDTLPGTGIGTGTGTGVGTIDKNGSMYLFLVRVYST